MIPQFDNSYARLPDRFFARQAPVPVAAPGLIRVNAALARDLGFEPDWLASAAGVAMLAGNSVPPGAEPVAQVYAGHQFGGWSPRLGDGRAILLGEVIDRVGARRDIVLKGAGRTPYSRGGDGRAWLGPVLREYLLSEAMFALGVPTTRALAAVTTGESVYRETGAMPGAVFARVASSHIRVGTFQYFAAQGDTEALAMLTQQAIARHFPGADGALGLLDHAVAAQAALIAQWMAIGFIHGVMNTDNCHVGGETIDYGPCAFMDAYDPDRVFSSIDRGGRYAYGNQPQIAVWNLAQFATALLPIMGEKNVAIEAATASVHRFADLFQAAWLARFRAKLGLVSAQDGDLALIEGLLGIMAAQGADFTRTFAGLAIGTAAAEFSDAGSFEVWAQVWQLRVANEPGATARMQAANPVLVPRNHRVEGAITAALGGDLAPFHRLADALERPYAAAPNASDLTAAPLPAEVVRATFCGT